MNYIAVCGSGNPNDEDGEYKQAIGLLYGIAFTIKMSKKGDHQIDGYFDYVVPPLEGFWWQDVVVGVDYANKDSFQWVSVIRLPDFVTKEDFNWAVSEATEKKKQDYSKVEFFTYDEGLCVQCMHIGASYEELVGMLVENADEPYAEEIAKTVKKWQKKGKAIETTKQFKEAIEEALCIVPEKERKEAVKKSCQRSFQALRIDVNSEFEVLYAFLEKLPEVLAPNGRVAILTFHSGEDRLVKRSFKELQNAGIYSEISKDAIRPSTDECVRNGRAKCTKMRWAIRAE